MGLPHHLSTGERGAVAWVSYRREGSLFGIITVGGNKVERRAGEAIMTTKDEIFAHYDQSVISVPFSNAPFDGRLPS